MKGTKHTDRYIPGNLEPDDPGERTLHNGPTDKEQDRKFQDAMLLAIARRQESIPLEANTAVRDSVPMRRWVPGQVLTASNLEN